MYTSEQQLKFQGFHPSSFTRSYLQDRMDQLLDESPDGATLKATFSRDGHSFKGLIAINSSAGRFFSVAQGTRLKEVVNNLTKQIRRDLARWKVKRFDTDQKSAEVVA